MKRCRALRRRGLALFLALTVCISMIQAAAFAEASGVEYCTVTFQLKGDGDKFIEKDGDKIVDGASTKTIKVKKGTAVGLQMPLAVQAGDKPVDQVKRTVPVWHVSKWTTPDGDQFTQDTVVNEDVTVTAQDWCNSGSYSYSRIEPCVWLLEPTCNYDGICLAECYKCGAIASKLDSGSKMGHVWWDDDGDDVPWQDDNQDGAHSAGCTSTQHRRICFRCKGKEPRGVQYESHQYDKWQEGQTERKCKSCDHKETRTLPSSTVTITYIDDSDTTIQTDTTVKDAEYKIKDLPDTVMPPEGKEFGGWEDSGGNIHQPGETITPDRDLTLTAQWKDLDESSAVEVRGGHTTTYNGQEQALPKDKVTVTVGGVETADFAIARYEDKDGKTVTPKDAGEYTAVIKRDGKEIGRVKFTIEPAVLTVTYSETIKKGGSPEGKVTVTGFVPGETTEGLGAAGEYTSPKVDLTGADPNTAGVYSGLPISGGAAKNYTFQYKPGTLTVTDTGKSTAEAETSYSPTYDGEPKPLPKDQVTVKVNGTPTTDFIIDHYEDGSGNRVTPKDAGTYKAIIEVTDKDGTKITTTVTYIVKPRPLTIHTASASKAYDGRPLTKTDGVTFTGLVDGETVSVTVTGSQTGVGSSDNTYTVDWENSTAKPGNYIITPDYGTLTVNEGGGGGSWPDPKPEPEPKPDPKPNPKPDPAPAPEPTPDPPPTPTNPQPGISDRPVAPDTGMVPYDPTIILDDLVPLAAPHLNVTDHFAYIVGYSDGLIRPQSCITRGEAATIFLRLMLDEYRRENWSTENPFSDVGPETWCNNAVSTCVKAGIIQGYSDGTFRPDAPITRAEFAAIAARFVSEDVPGYDYFTDMEGHWARISVARAVMAGWIQGDGRTFRPEDKMTRAETITLVNRMINRFPDLAYLLEDMIRWKDNPEDAWYYAELQEASNSHTYDLAETAFTEIWTVLLPNRDWAALEGEWAEAGSAPGGEVAPDLQEGYSGKQNDSEPSADAPS